jgi:hypothetical protein
MDRPTWFEVGGSALAIAYALLIASNTGNEILGPGPIKGIPKFAEI